MSASRTTRPSRVIARVSGPPSSKRAPPLGMLEDAVHDLAGQVKPQPLPFKDADHPPALAHVAKSARGQLVQDPLPGMAEGRMPEVVAEGDRLGQILVERQGPGDCAGDLVNLQRMGQAGAVMVPFRCEKYLGFVLESAEGLAMEDSVPVMLKHGTDRAGRFRAGTADTGAAQTSPRRQRLPFTIFTEQSYIHQFRTTHYCCWNVQILYTVPVHSMQIKISAATATTPAFSIFRRHS